MQRWFRKGGACLGKVIDLSRARASQKGTTDFAAWFARKTGATVLSQRPGHIVAVLHDETVVETRIRRVNVFAKEAKAYRDAGLAVPERVLRDMEHWDRVHGRSC